MPPLKIMLYEPYVYDDDALYGNHRLLLFIFRLLDTARYEAVLVTPKHSRFLDRIRAIGGRCVVINAPTMLTTHGGAILKTRRLERAKAVWAVFEHTRALASFIRAERIDVVQCHSVRALITAALAARITGTPCIWYIKSELGNPFLDRLGFWLANHILFLAEALKKDKYAVLRRHYLQKIGTLPLGVDLEAIREIEATEKSGLRDALKVRSDAINMCFVGVVCAHKGVDILVQAMRRVADAVPAAKLYVVGGYDLPSNRQFKAQLDRRVASLGLSEHIVFTGWRDDATAVLSLMDFLVLPSRSEGFGRCIVEAMALGKPAVGTRVGGIPDAIRDGETGLLVRPEDPESLADAMIRLAGDPELRGRLGTNARRVAFSDYSIQNTVTGLERLYDRLTARLTIGSGKTLAIPGVSPRRSEEHR